MARKFVIQELEPIEIVFRNKTLTCMLNNDALMLMDEEFGDIKKLAKEEKDKPYDFASKILYSGIKIYHKDFEYETAKRIIISGGLGLIAEVLENFMENFMSNATEEEMQRYQGELERLLKEIG